MQKLFLVIFSTLLFAACSTSPNNNGGSTTTVVPVAPSNLTGSVLSSSSVSLSWTDNSTNETGFKVERRLNGATQFSVVGTVNADVTGFVDANLTANTSYEYRVYSFNAVGNSLNYSNTVILTTSSQSYTYTQGPNVMDANGNIYPSIVTSCGQTWTSKNLNVSRYRNGDVIPQVTDATQWANLTTGAWCWPNNDSATNWQYGKLYNWYAVNDPRGLAPQGWHVPFDAEWNIITKCIDPNADTTQCCNNVAGPAMKSISWTGGTNTSGFNGILVLYPRGSSGSFNVFFGSNTGSRWWGANVSGTSSVTVRCLSTTSSNALQYYSDEKKCGFSVRLVKD